MHQPIVEATGLRKSYGDVHAVVDVSLSVRRGQIFGIVGPNGAGKTTAVEMVQGLRPPDAGSVRLLGVDPFVETGIARQRVGTQLQQAVLQDRLEVREALELYGSYYDRAVPADQLLREWDLEDKQDAAFETLSGGQRQRLFIALALVGTPEVVFLDELTTGLDPAARRATWSHVRQIRDRGVTVVLVTHFMDEAEQLCDVVAVVDQGRVIACDTPEGLISTIGGSRTVRFSRPSHFDPAWLQRLDSVARVEVDGQGADGDVVVVGDGPVLAEVATALAAKDVVPGDLSVERASLEDVFLAMTSTGSRGPAPDIDDGSMSRPARRIDA